MVYFAHYAKKTTCGLTGRWRTALVGMHVNGKNQFNSSMETDMHDHDNSTPRRQCQLCRVEAEEHGNHYTGTRFIITAAVHCGLHLARAIQLTTSWPFNVTYFDVNEKLL